MRDLIVKYYINLIVGNSAWKEQKSAWKTKNRKGDEFISWQVKTDEKSIDVFGLDGVLVITSDQFLSWQVHYSFKYHVFSIPRNLIVSKFNYNAIYISLPWDLSSFVAPFKSCLCALCLGVELWCSLGRSLIDLIRIALVHFYILQIFAWLQAQIDTND